MPDVFVSTAAGLQAALDAAVDGQTIRCTPGTYIGNFVLPVRPLTAPVIIRTDAADAAINPTTFPWVEPTSAASMVKLQALDTFNPVLTAAWGAHDWTLIGIEFVPNTTHPDRDLCSLGDGMTGLSQVPTTITFDRCYFHGHPSSGQHRGLMFNVANGTVTKCYFEKFIEVGRDSQAVCVINGPGPFLFEDSYFEATGENMLFGGGDPQIYGLVPSDITIRNCFFFKPTAWRATFPGSVKNLFELKNAQRVLIENCVFANCWVDAQAGHAVVFTIRNQDGNAPWSIVDRVTFQYNVISNCEGSAINMLGQDDIQTSGRGTNMVIQNNLILSATNGFNVNRGYQPTTLTHNTIPTLSYKWFQFVSTPMAAGQFICQNNIVGGSLYGIAGEGSGLGTPTLEVYAPSSVFDHNVIEAGPSFIPFPAGNTLLATGALAALLDANDVYLGAEPSSDGPPIGADIPGLRARIPWWFGVTGADAAAALSGSTSTGAVGTLAPPVTGDVTVTLTSVAGDYGVGLVGTVSVVGADVTADLFGVTGTALDGLLHRDNTWPLGGMSVVGSVGSLLFQERTVHMAATTLFNGPFVSVADANGAPLVGAQITVFEAGGSTPAAVYTDPDLQVAWNQPLLTNSAGHTDGPVYVSPTPALKIVVVDAEDVPVSGYPVDDWSPSAVGV